MTEEEGEIIAPEEAIRMMVDQVFTQHGPQYNPDIRDAAEAVIKSIAEMDGIDGVPDGSAIGKAIVVASMINSVLIPVIEVFGAKVAAIMLEEMAGRYKAFGMPARLH